MNKLFTSILSLTLLTSATAQVTTDTVTTEHNYENQQFYSLSNGVQASNQYNSWNIGFGVDAFTYDAPIRFNSLIGDIRELPNADINDLLTEVDTTGWGAQSSLYDSDANVFHGALSREEADQNDLLYFWGKYDTQTHNINPIRTFGALIGTDFYVMRFKLSAVQNVYTIEYAKLTDAEVTTFNIDLNGYASKNYVYFNLAGNNIVDFEPAAADWDLFFGKYYTNYQGIAMYPVAGVMTNGGVQVARVVDANAENYAFTWQETFSSENNIIGYDWKQAGQTGVTMADTLVYFVKAKTGAIWKVFFTNFISGTQTDELAGSYIFNKELISTVATKENQEIFTQLYPNPSNSKVQLVVDATSNTTVEIYNLSGQNMFTTRLEAGMQTVNIGTADMANGMYQVVITTSTQQKVIKLAIQH